MGWREWLTLPSLGIEHIKAKVDTGARTSALHTFGLEVYQDQIGNSRVRFQVHPLQRNEDYVVECDCPVTNEKSVKDSGGHEEIRPFITIPIVVGPYSFDAEVSLTNRDNMKFRMLLGRTSLRGRFLVNSALSYQIGPKPKH